jgi:hypothetical protein
VARGVLAGIAGTAAMTGWQLLAAKLRPTGDEGAGAQDDPPQDPWDAASAPAKVARRIGEGVFRRDVSPDLIPLLTNVMHWGYGTGWGAVRGLLGLASLGPATATAAHLTAVWGSEAVMLPSLGVAPPFWTWGAEEVAIDVGHHVVYAAVTGAIYELLD